MSTCNTILLVALQVSYMPLAFRILLFFLCFYGTAPGCPHLSLFCTWVFSPSKCHNKMFTAPAISLTTTASDYWQTCTARVMLVLRANMTKHTHNTAGSGPSPKCVQFSKGTSIQEGRKASYINPAWWFVWFLGGLPTMNGIFSTFTTLYYAQTA